jgi:glutathione peroxidase
VLGFPSNDFGGQETRSTFPMFAKIPVKGKEAHFHKYLVDRSGSKVLSFDTRVKPNDPKLVTAIERLLENR